MEVWKCCVRHCFFITPCIRDFRCYDGGLGSRAADLRNSPEWTLVHNLPSYAVKGPERDLEGIRNGSESDMERIWKGPEKDPEGTREEPERDLEGIRKGSERDPKADLEGIRKGPERDPKGIRKRSERIRKSCFATGGAWTSKRKIDSENG